MLLARQVNKMILVDSALWTWRDQKWAHLVSDSSYRELHEFASRLGKRRISFQGDHYDVNESERKTALDLGATAVGCRDLLKSIRSNGLRRRSRLEAWNIICDQEVEGSSIPHLIVRSVTSLYFSRQLVIRLNEFAPDLTDKRVKILIVQRSNQAAFVISGPLGQCKEKTIDSDATWARLSSTGINTTIEIVEGIEWS
jgi:hypothetical protein